MLVEIHSGFWFFFLAGGACDSNNKLSNNIVLEHNIYPLPVWFLELCQEKTQVNLDSSVTFHSIYKYVFPFCF